jgi:hypothetical protein
MWTALLNREVINLESMSASDKIVLRAEAPPFMCRGCKGPVHTRHVPDGEDDDPFLVFAHNPGAAALCREFGYHTDESDEHHRLKSTLATSARSAGWSVDLEVPGEGCKADVVVTRGERTRVLEAQLSALSIPDAVERTKRYTRAFGDPLWTHTRRRDWSKQVPSIQIDNADGPTPNVIGGVMVDQEGRIHAPAAPLIRVVPRILNNSLSYIYGAAEQYGFYIDLAQASSARPPTPQPEPAPRGAYVKDTCERPPVVGTAPPALDIASRVICDWCGLPTARLKPNGQPRHLWCEETDRGIWSRMQRPPQDRKVVG